MGVNNMFPNVTINSKKIMENTRILKEICEANGIEFFAVIKGCNAILDVIDSIKSGGIYNFASSRISQLSHFNKIYENTKRLLIRMPALSEVKEVVEYCDISFNSELETIKELDKVAKRYGKIHKVILMDELGDLREGYYDKEKLIEDAIFIENKLDNIELAGIATNLGCYGTVKTTKEKMEELVQDAKKIEEAIDRKLEYISGGGTFAMSLVLNGQMPKEVNMLRVGEGLLLGRDLPVGEYDILDGINHDTFILELEVIEVNEKPTYPIGELAVDGFGFTKSFEDLGIRKRAILQGGRIDFGFEEFLIPKDEKIKVLGASSDHTIIDIHDIEHDIKVGDIISFELNYPTLAYITGSMDRRLSLV